jgi:hypothetical protein
VSNVIDRTRRLARLSVALSIAAITSALIGWIAFVIAIDLGENFNDPNSRSAVLLLCWLLLGVLAIVAWIAACAVAVITFGRARRESQRAGWGAIAMAAVVPVTWALEWAALVVWFGFEALSGPWLM